MSNLPGKITDPHLSAEEPLTFRRCLRFILQALGCWPSAAQLSSELSEFYLFSFSNFPCRIRAILYAHAIFTCILTGKAPASNDNTPQ